MPRTSSAATKIANDGTDPAWSIPSLREPRYSQSLERGLAILPCFTPSRPVLGPFLPMSCETLVTWLLLTFEGENGARHDVGCGAERSRRPRSAASRRRAERRGHRARWRGGGPWPRAGRAGEAQTVLG